LLSSEEYTSVIIRPLHVSLIDFSVQLMINYCIDERETKNDRLIGKQNEDIDMYKARRGDWIVKKRSIRTLLKPI